MTMLMAPLAGKINAKLGPRLQLTIGMLLSTAGLLGLAQLGVHSSYNAIWPFYVLLGSGIALTLPSASAAAMGAIDPRKAGVGSGVLNAARQVGGALGIAIIGSVATAITDRSWCNWNQPNPDPREPRVRDWMNEHDRRQRSHDDDCGDGLIGRAQRPMAHHRLQRKIS